MRAALLLAIFVPLALLAAALVVRKLVEPMRRRQRIAQLEAENERLDNLKTRLAETAASEIKRRER